MRRSAIFPLLIFLLLFAGAARAILPPDATAREPQIRAQRIRLQQDYEKRQIERQEKAVQAYEQTRRDIFTPPGKRAAASSAGVLKPVAGTAPAQAEASENKPHRFLVSFVLITLLLAVAGWVRYATKDVD